MNTVNVRNRYFGGVEQDFASDFSRAHTKIRLFDRSVKFGSRLAGKVVLDVGSSTGGFTNFALEKGAKKVIAVEIGSRQMDPRLLTDHRVKLYEKTDILNLFSNQCKVHLLNNYIVHTGFFQSSRLRRVSPPFSHLQNLWRMGTIGRVRMGT